ncbi:MAG: hypothetical protein KF891_20580 [Rhizobacter sp.]|nr:hypothetical protein [Rhizobacter sp.]
MKSVVWKLALALCVLLWQTPLWAAAPLATVTIVDGDALLLRDASRFALAEGVRLEKDDIVETPATARFLRIEFGDGVILDLGPESRLLLGAKLPGDRARLPARLHLLRGVAKLTVPKPLAPAAGSFTTPALDVLGVAHSAVFIVQGVEAQVFAESGAVTLQGRRGGRPAGSTTVKSSEFYSRGADAKGSTGERPTPAFIQRLPRPFLDTLPARAKLFADREVPPKPLGELDYADAEPWIDADGLRAHFAARWRALARNPAFREGVAAHMVAHPEWDRILFPEKYLPKPAASAPSAAYGHKP